MKIFQDGDKYCIVKDSFIDLQSSDALFISKNELDSFKNNMINSIKDLLFDSEFESSVKEIENIIIEGFDEMIMQETINKSTL